jgi:hypothetical protein
MAKRIMEKGQTMMYTILHRKLRPSNTNTRYDNVTLSPLLLQRGSRFGLIQRSARSDSHWAVFCPNSVEVVRKINGGER